VTATDDRVWPEGFDPEHAQNCNLCADHLKRQEAELGLRCSGCLEVFGRRSWITPSEDDPSVCGSCQRIAVYRATAPVVTPMYGKPRNA
jgi:hypothetical protein